MVSSVERLLELKKVVIRVWRAASNRRAEHFYRSKYSGAASAHQVSARQNSPRGWEKLNAVLLDALEGMKEQCG